MQGRSALVTGSTRGIGAAIAAALAAEGCNVMLNGFGDAGAELGTDHQFLIRTRVGGAERPRRLHHQ